MKIRNRDRRIDVSNIYINKTDYGTNIIMIINNKVHKIDFTSIYSDLIFEKIENYLQEMEGIKND